MDKCAEFANRFTLTGQDRGIKEVQAHELGEYQLIYNDLIARHTNSCGEAPEGMDIQVINKIMTQSDENITPLGLVNVSLEYLAKILTFAKAHGIKWQIDCRECTDTHFKKLSHFNVRVDCPKDHFVSMARKFGFRY